MPKLDYKSLEQKLGYKFTNKKYILNALIHSSYANETKEKRESNERLEFLGDSVLGLIVSDYIFFYCPSFTEGELTKLRSYLVCEKTLCKFSKKLNLSDFLITSRGEKNSGGNHLNSVLADAFESVTAAIYLDGGLKSARKFILKFILPLTKNPKLKNFEDYKTNLQEIIQKTSKDKLEYNIVLQKGPDHDRMFWVEVSISSKTIGKGKGKSKKAAEQEAAKDALKSMKKQNQENKNER